MTGTATAPPSAAERVAAALGWTPGQVWTVALGLALAIPAGIFGLGPALDDLPSTTADVAAPAPISAPTATTAPDAGAPTITAPAAWSTRSTVEAATPPTGGSSAAPVAVERRPAAGSTPPPTIARTTRSVSVPGPGEARAVASGTDASFVAVDRGAEAPGAVVVVDGDGDVAAAIDLVVDGVTHRGAQGVAVDDRGVLVTTTFPAAVLRIDPVAETVEAVATIPDLPTCLPVARASDCQPGAVDTAPVPSHLAVDADGTAYVVDRAQGCVFRIDGDAAAPWLCDLGYAPSPTAEGRGLRGIASTGDAVLLTARLAVGDRDVVDEITVVDGHPGTRRRLADLDATEEVDGVAVLGDGRVAVALTSPGAVLVISPDDPADERRLTGFQRPADVDAREGRLLVIEQAQGAAGTLRERPTPAD